MDNLAWPGMELEAHEKECLVQLRRLTDAWLDMQVPVIGTYAKVLRRWASDGCLARYCRARHWDVKRADKMLRATLEWRIKMRPEDITWESVKHEAATGKTYKSTAADREDRPLMVMCPGRENTQEVTSQIRYLVYTMETVINGMPPDVPRGSHTDISPEQMVWCVDFTGYTLAKAPPFSTSLLVLQTLQNHYPERLGRAIPYNPPRIFGMFWTMISAFFDPITANKVKFVFPPKPGKPNPMGEMFNLQDLEKALGGLKQGDWDPLEYGKRMMACDEERDRAIAQYVATH